MTHAWYPAVCVFKTWYADHFIQVSAGCKRLGGKLNSDKTEVLIITKLAQCIGSLTFTVNSSIRKHSVIFDQAMHFENNIRSLKHTFFIHLRNIAKLRSTVLQPELEMTIHAFISSQLDYCSSLFTCLNKSSLDCIQSVQNDTARLWTRSSGGLISRQYYFLYIGKM